MSLRACGDFEGNANSWDRVILRAGEDARYLLILRSGCHRSLDSAAAVGLHTETMKFGQRFHTFVVPGWEAYYVDYGRFKAAIKQLGCRDDASGQGTGCSTHTMALFSLLRHAYVTNMEKRTSSRQ